MFDFLFYPLDLFLAVWQDILIMLAYHPWLMLIPMFALTVVEIIEWRERKKYDQK